MKGYLIFGLFLFTLYACSTTKADSNKQIETENLVKSGSFVFKAQTAMPNGGRLINLTEGYDLRVSKDTINAYLPFYGKAYSIPYGSNEGGIKFTSTDFNYTLTPKKKGSWDITIIPKDYRDVQQIYLNISSSGYANLQVVSLNRDQISFHGYIQKK